MMFRKDFESNIDSWLIPISRTQLELIGEHYVSNWQVDFYIAILYQAVSKETYLNRQIFL